MTHVRVWIADDHAIFRNGLAAVLERAQGIEVVGESADGDATLAALRRVPVDVVILDLSMPGLPSLDVARAVSSERPELKIVVLTMHTEVEYLQAAMAAGVHGYVLKASASDELVRAVHAVVAGGRYVEPELAARALATRPAEPRGARSEAGIESLTQREQEVLTQLVMGHTNTEIGAQLFISDRTVETHRKNILEKLGVKTRAELVRLALKQGLVRLD